VGGDPGSQGVPSRPWYVFNNSWYLRCPIIGGSDPGGTESPDFTANLSFFNNAMQWCDPAGHSAHVCEPVEPVRNLDWRRSKQVSFDYDICNRGDFKGFFAAPGDTGEPNGRVAIQPLFLDGRGGDFGLASGSEAAGAGVPHSLARLNGRDAAIRPGASGRLNMGAWQSYGLTSVPDLEDQADRILSGLGVLPAG
jgi:hypothetical protein